MKENLTLMSQLLKLNTSRKLKMKRTRLEKQEDSKLKEKLNRKNHSKLGHQALLKVTMKRKLKSLLLQIQTENFSKRMLPLPLKQLPLNKHSKLQRQLMLLAEMLPMFLTHSMRKLELQLEELLWQEVDHHQDMEEAIEKQLRLPLHQQLLPQKLKQLYTK
jgi:hypothetical protein